jgi:hypothetical protein
VASVKLPILDPQSFRIVISALHAFSRLAGWGVLTPFFGSSFIQYGGLRPMTLLLLFFSAAGDSRDMYTTHKFDRDRNPLDLALKTVAKVARGQRLAVAAFHGGILMHILLDCLQRTEKNTISQLAASAITQLAHEPSVAVKLMVLGVVPMLLLTIKKSINSPANSSTYSLSALTALLQVEVVRKLVGSQLSQAPDLSKALVDLIGDSKVRRKKKREGEEVRERLGGWVGRWQGAECGNVLSSICSVCSGLDGALRTVGEHAAHGQRRHRSSAQSLQHQSRHRGLSAGQRHLRSEEGILFGRPFRLAAFLSLLSLSFSLSLSLSVCSLLSLSLFSLLSLSALSLFLSALSFSLLSLSLSVLSLSVLSLSLYALSLSALSLPLCLSAPSAPSALSVSLPLCLSALCSLSLLFLLTSLSSLCSF